MIDAGNVNNLAETLKKSGLVASTTEAMRMAKNIVTTDSKVSKDFDEKKNEIDKSLETKKYENKQDEINDLIKRTDFNKKDYFVPVNGYKKVPVKKVMENSETKKEDVKKPEIKVKQEQKKEPVKKPDVYTDKFDDELTLKEIMAEDAEDIYRTEEEDSVEEKPATEIRKEPEPKSEPEEEIEKTIEKSKQEFHESTEELSDKKQAVKQETEPNEYNLVFLDNNFDSKGTSSDELSEKSDSEINKQTKDEPDDQNIPAEKEGEKEDEFIIDIEEDSNEKSILDSDDSLEDKVPEQKQVKPDQSAKKQVQQKKDNQERNRKPKKPIEKVDLMDHFNFGS
ncbi:hypothetical protein GF327_04745 [Candidatus Woesearchaeota archaeon]|nr:hypothetical protein [Candidatus Woesearchaeota archaeon]